MFLIIVFSLGPIGSIPVAVAIVTGYVAIHGLDVLGTLQRRLQARAP